jgi:hypothetical protein
MPVVSSSGAWMQPLRPTPDGYGITATASVKQEAIALLAPSLVAHLNISGASLLCATPPQTSLNCGNGCINHRPCPRVHEFIDVDRGGFDVLVETLCNQFPIVDAPLFRETRIDTPAGLSSNSGVARQMRDSG